MTIDTYGELLAHVGHEIKCVTYGKPGTPDNVAIECETCSVVLVDFNRPSRFVVVARTPDNPIHDQISLLPVTLPEDELTSGPATALLRYSAVAQTINKERWQIVTDAAGDPTFFTEEFAAFDALWALASSPETCDGIIIIATQLVAHLRTLDDERFTILEHPDDGPVVANYLNQLRDAIDAINP